jgi:hypothetical protein
VALTLITEGATSNATDLNQVVNLLNGTTTDTQVTVNGPISAQMPGTSAAMRYVGGIAPPLDYTLYGNQTHADGLGDSFFAPIQIPLMYGSTATVGAVGTSVNGTYYGASDMAWAPGGPIAIGATAPTSQPWIQAGGLPLGNPSPGQNAPMTIGSGGYVCRAHQSGAVTVNSNTVLVGTDTVDYDPRGMYRPSAYGSGGAITIPFPGMWGFLASIHGAENQVIDQWQVVVTSGVTGISTATPFPCPDTPNNAAAPYTGSSVTGFAILGFGYNAGSPAMNPGNPPYQLAFRVPFTPPNTYALDTSGPDRTYIAVWLIG